MNSDTKEISITICDDCMDIMDIDKHDKSKIIRLRKAVYYTSTIITVAFLLFLFYWTYSITMEVNTMEEE